jgi:cytochrome c peroxidase
MDHEVVSMNYRTVWHWVAVVFAATAACADSDQVDAIPSESVDATSATDSIGPEDVSVPPDASTRASLLRQRGLESGLVSLHDIELVETGAELTALGRDLYFDPIMGGEMDVACSTCHHPDHGFADGVDFPIGVGGVGLGPDREYAADAQESRILGPLRPLGRSSPTVLNLQLLALEADARNQPTPFLWDGRADELSDFTQMPITVRDEMRGDAWTQLSGMASLLERLDTHEAWRARFEEVYGLAAGEPIDVVHLQRALNSFMLSLNSPPNRLDDFLDGSSEETDQFLNGLELFMDLSCVSCHNGASMSDGRFHLTGVPVGELSRRFAGGVDIGHMEATGRDSDRYLFRTAPLREIGSTAPYMHNGSFETLEDVIRFYMSDDNALTEVDPPVPDDRIERGTPRQLTDAEISDLVTFLNALTTTSSELNALFPEPSSVPSGLPPSAVPAELR